MDRIKSIPVIKPLPEMRGDRLPFPSFIVGRMERFRIQSGDLLKLLDAAATEATEAAAVAAIVPHYVTDEISSSNYGSRFKKSTGKLEVWQFIER